MKTLFIVLYTLVSLLATAQQYDSLLEANNEATLQLLHIIDNEIDSSIKVLYINGDVYADTAFWKYAQEKNIPYVLIKRTVAKNDEAAFDSIKNISLPCLEINVSSKHNTFTVCFSDIIHDPENIAFYLSLARGNESCQTWTWDKKNNALVKKKTK